MPLTKELRSKMKTEAAVLRAKAKSERPLFTYVEPRKKTGLIGAARLRMKQAAAALRTKIEDEAFERRRRVQRWLLQSNDEV